MCHTRSTAVHCEIRESVNFPRQGTNLKVCKYDGSCDWYKFTSASEGSGGKSKGVIDFYLNAEAKIVYAWP